jgi:hypothetical protein
VCRLGTRQADEVDGQALAGSSGAYVLDDKERIALELGVSGASDVVALGFELADEALGDSSFDVVGWEGRGDAESVHVFDCIEAGGVTGDGGGETGAERE